jgi:hypothetical protein
MSKSVDRARDLTQVNNFDTWAAIIWILLIITAVEIVYGDSLHLFFSQDDFVFLKRASHIVSWKSFIDSFVAPDHFYRPVPRVGVFTLLLRLFGLNAGAFHLVSLGIHALNATLLFLLCRRIFKTTLLAGISGFIYAIHPMSFLAVYWISGIQDLCLVSFSLLSLHCFLCSIESQNNTKLWHILSLLMYSLALLSKEMAVTLPLLLIVIKAAHQHNHEIHIKMKGLINVFLGYGVLLIVYLCIRSRKSFNLAPNEGPYALSLAPSIVLKNLWNYTSNALGLQYLKAPLYIMQLLFVVWIVALIILILVSRRYRGVILVGATWFTISLFPILCLTNRIYNFYAYLPLAGIAMVIATVIYVLWKIAEKYITQFKTFNRPSLNLPNLSIALLLIAGLWFSKSTIQTKKTEDPAGIISKSILAKKAITEVRTLYPKLPHNSILYVTNLTNRDVWAFGHGDLFRLYYPHVQVILVPENEQASISNNKNFVIYRFRKSK